MKGKFLTLAFHPLTKLGDVKRYSCTKLQEDETLAQHVSDMMMMSYMIGCTLTAYGEQLDIGTLLEKCLVHDADEVITGDIPRNTKYASDIAHEAIEQLAEDSVKKMAMSVPGGARIYESWKSAKSGKEGMIVKLVDMLCVVKKSLTEVELHNNLSALKVIAELTGHLGGLRDYLNSHSDDFESSYTVEYLVELIDDSIQEVNGIYYKYKNIIDKYSICDNILK